MRNTGSSEFLIFLKTRNSNEEMQNLTKDEAAATLLAKLGSSKNTVYEMVACTREEKEKSVRRSKMHLKKNSRSVCDDKEMCPGYNVLPTAGTANGRTVCLE